MPRTRAREHAKHPPAHAERWLWAAADLGLLGLTSEVPVYRCAADAERYRRGETDVPFYEAYNPFRHRQQGPYA